jgi:hypothetical protein
VPIVLKSGSLNLLEPSGQVKGCNGIALPLLYLIKNAKRSDGYQTAKSSTQNFSKADSRSTCQEIPLLLKPTLYFSIQA